MKVKIDDIHPMVKAQAYKELEINMGGSIDFNNPIVLLRTTRAEWLDFKNNKAQFILDPPETLEPILQIRCGHNRVELAKMAGATEIEAIIFDSLEDAAQECHRQNRWYKERYGALV